MTTYVDLFGAGLVALIAREPRKCEVYNDLSGDLALLLRHAALHADALDAAIAFADTRPLAPDTELARCIRFFRSVEPVLSGTDSRRKITALRARLARVYIEHLPPADLVRFFDSPDTEFFAPASAFPQAPLEALVIDSELGRARGKVISDSNTLAFVPNNETRFPLFRRQDEAAR